MEEQKEKLSFGNLFFMAIGASLAIAINKSLSGGMISAGILVAAASLLGSGIYRLFFRKFEVSNLLIILISSFFIVIILILSTGQ
jgi:hypothetical protein